MGWLTDVPIASQVCVFGCVVKAKSGACSINWFIYLERKKNKINEAIFHTWVLFIYSTGKETDKLRFINNLYSSVSVHKNPLTHENNSTL